MASGVGSANNMGPPGPNGIPAAIWNLPALRPPPGIKSNFEHPETRAREIIVMNAIFLTLMVLAIGMRFCVRRAGNSAFSWDGCRYARVITLMHF
jgi:hypothetical protein